MNLPIDVLAKVLSEYTVKVVFENLEMTNPSEIVEGTCCKAILKIREILDNENLEDFECVERIVLLLENIGLDGGSRHDFS